MNYLECSLYGEIDNLTLYFHNENKEYYYYEETQDYHLYLKYKNETFYIGKNINCFYDHNVNYLDIFRGACKNGAYFFTIDFNNIIKKNGDQNLTLKNKILLEFGGKIRNKEMKNYCYIDNSNEKIISI